jgi:hypothetical protein
LAEVLLAELQYYGNAAHDVQLLSNRADTAGHIHDHAAASSCISSLDE